VYVKDLATADGYLMQLVRYDAGGVAPIEGAATGALLYVVNGELIYDGQRFWPGTAAVIPPSCDAEGRSDSGCTFVCVHRAEPPPETGESESGRP
jgi:hypothetical protein